VGGPVHGRLGKLIEPLIENAFRHAACLLADIGWRAHPAIGAKQSLNIIANAAFVGVAIRVERFCRLAVFLPPRRTDRRRVVAALAGIGLQHARLDRARVLGVALRWPT